MTKADHFVDKLGSILTDSEIRDALTRPKGDPLGIKILLRTSDSEGEGDSAELKSRHSIGSYLTKEEDPSPRTQVFLNEYIEKRITAIGIDVTFDSFHEVYCLNERKFLKRKRVDNVRSNHGFQIEIPPRATITVITREWFGLGSSIVGFIQSKVTNVYQGFSHISTTIDPNWEGTLMLTFENTTDAYITLEHGDPIATATFAIAMSPRNSTEVRYNRNEARWTFYRKQARYQFRYKIYATILLLLGLSILVPLLSYEIALHRSGDQSASFLMQGLASIWAFVEKYKVVSVLIAIALVTMGKVWRLSALRYIRYIADILHGGPRF